MDEFFKNNFHPFFFLHYNWLLCCARIHDTNQVLVQWYPCRSNMSWEIVGLVSILSVVSVYGSSRWNFHIKWHCNLHKLHVIFIERLLVKLSTLVYPSIFNEKCIFVNVRTSQSKFQAFLFLYIVCPDKVSLFPCYIFEHALSTTFFPSLFFK